MNPAAAALAATILMSPPSFATQSPAERMTMPIPSTASVCPVDGSTCLSQALPAGADLLEFIERAVASRGTSRLHLTLPAGIFELRRSWIINGGDLPSRIARVTISGATGGVTQLSGSSDLVTLGVTTHRDFDSNLVIKLPEPIQDELKHRSLYTSEQPAWPTLHANGGDMRLSRWPANGWATFTSSTDDDESRTIRPQPDTPIIDWRREGNAWIWGFLKFGWHADYSPLRIGIEGDVPELRIAGSTRYGIGNAGRFRVLNLRSEIRKEGDYFIDTRRGVLMVRTRRDTPAKSLRLTLLESPLLHLRAVRGVEVSDIEFAETRGHGIVVEKSTDVELSGLSFSAIGRAGVVVDGGENVRVLNSRFQNLGDQAVILRGGDRSSLAPSGHSVEGCHIARPSQRINTPATAIRLEGVGHVVRRNTIADTPHSALYFDGNDHLIEDNWIERTCLDVDDAGAIYAGRDWTARGTIIRRNVFSDIRAKAPNTTAAAVYLDDMLSGIRVEDNLMIDVDYGVLIGGGRDNQVLRNFFYRVRKPLHVDERARTWAQRAVAPGEVMDQRLRAVPLQSERWRAAYPRLASMPRDRAAIPEGNEIRDNVSAQSGAPALTPISVATGAVQPPADLTLPREFANAAELLEYCAEDGRCVPFTPRRVAR